MSLDKKDNLQLLKDTILSNNAGEMNFDSVKSTMNIRNIFSGSSLQVGQEMYIFCVNNNGVTLEEGDVVQIDGYDSTLDAFQIVKSKADTIENAEVLGVVTTQMLIGAVGLVTSIGRVNDLDTTGFSEGDIIYLSPTVAGTFTATKPSAIPIQVGCIGKVDALIGFVQVDVRSLPSSIRGTFSDSADQTYTANVSKAINFDTNNVLEGITHSESVNNDEFTFDSGGVYVITIEPQYTRISGGGTDVLNMYIQKDTGSGFVNIVDSNVKLAINTSAVTTVSPLTQAIKVVATDKIRIMIQVESTNLKLDAFAAFGSSPNDVPATPSVIMNIHRLGD